MRLLPIGCDDVKPITAQWREDHGAVSKVRPAGYRLVADSGFFPMTVVSPVLTPADPDWKSKPGSLEWQTNAESFNRHVGWKVAYWHWSVVESGRLLGAGDSLTVEEAKGNSELALPAKILKRLTVS